jgi:hypothetical protein
MDEPLSRISLRALTDHGLLAHLRVRHCEVFIGRTGQFTIAILEHAPHASLPALLIRETFRRRVRLTPFARVNGIRLRQTGELSEAA